jgi:hypothetical protein
MQIRCECGKFRAELTTFPRNTPGRLACYCDDCQTYLHYLGRSDLLDAAGGTEIIPVYPSEIKFLEGMNVLKSTCLSPKGLIRWSTTCCNTPIANTRPQLPWAGFLNRVFNIEDPSYLEKVLGPVKSRIKGRFARGTPPIGTAPNLRLKDITTVLPFLLKGLLLSKTKNSPFFKKDGVTPVVEPQILRLEERTAIRHRLGFSG